MAKQLRYDGKIALVTGAGNGLGRSHARLLGSRGAKVVVNDLGGGSAGQGKGSEAADRVVAEIIEAGGEAVANYDSVEDGAKLVQCAMDSFGGLDIVINNAGILRDRTFAKMSQEDWDLIYRVHVLGAFRVTHAAWPILRERQYGRLIFTSSAAGIYGNFGQANYSMAKLGLAGFANTLALEGGRRNIHVNTIAPLAQSRMTEGILPEDMLSALEPEHVTALVGYLVHEDCEENGGLFEVGGGFYGKLRWERAAGQMFRTGRDLQPEDVKRTWGVITSFEETTHPPDVNASLQPILANIQKGPSLGGNALIDLDLALGYEAPEMTSTHTKRDMSLYALGVGAGADPTDAKDLQLVYEMSRDGFRTLPTFGVVPPINAMLESAKAGVKAPGLNYGLDRLLHGEQYTEVLRPIPAEGTLTHKSKITDIWDKGKNAVVITETKSFDEDGDLLVVNRFSAVIRGAGGFGGERGPGGDGDNAPPDREPDAVIKQSINASQALLYRLSGDWNPLHADPGMAKMFGFERPILHGLCTFGHAARHVITAFCEGDPRLFKSIQVRFAGSVYPGETLVTEMWKEDDLKVVLRCKVAERDEAVITRAAVELYAEIPKKAEKKVEAEPAVDEGPAEPTSADVFGAIASYIADNPDLASQVGHSFVFELKEPASAWKVDLTAAPGSVSAGGGKVDCTLALTDDNFMKMCTGKADAQKLYFGGELQISGNVMASQKLEFLRKLEPERVAAAMAARTGGGDAAPVAAPVPAEPEAPAREPLAPAMFGALEARLALDSALAAEVGALVVVNVTGPDNSWTLDLRTGAGSVSEGATQEADATLTIADEDLPGLGGPAADPRDLFMRGKLRVDGDVSVAQRLGVLKGLIEAGS